MTDFRPFHEERRAIFARQRDSAEAQQLSQQGTGLPDLKQTSYTFNWLGRPVIQYPQDLIAMQELLFTVQPDCIIETGTAQGGSLIFYASLLELNALCGGPEQACVYGVGIDINAHNREAIEAHPLYSRGRIHMLQGSSVDPEIIAQVHEAASRHSRIVVVLDSNHTHEHVLAELEAYAQLVTPGSYCVVFDTTVASISKNAHSDRPQNTHTPTMTAVQTWLMQHREFEANTKIDTNLLISVEQAAIHDAHTRVLPNFLLLHPSDITYRENSLNLHPLSASPKTTVVHLIPHMGGGVGKVLQKLVGWCAENTPFLHQVIAFESVNDSYKEWAAKSGIALHDAVSPESTWLHECVMAADVAHLHFWNHPTNWHFMRAFSGKPARLIAWSHVNGVSAPQYIPQQAIDFFDCLVTSSLFSLRNPHVKQGMDTGACSHIFTSAGYGALNTVTHQPQPRFTVGYIGTVDYCKVHPQFLDVCHALSSSGIDVRICGGPSHKTLAAEYQHRFGASHTSGTVQFLGQVSDVAAVLSQLDVFFYPLAPGNYGTGEQVLIEALAAGVPQVVLSGGPETSVVRDQQTAVVVEHIEDMAAAITSLQNDPDRMHFFSTQSRALAQECYPLAKTGQHWQNMYENIILRPKTVRNLSCLPAEPWPVALFLTALGDTPEGTEFARAFAELPEVSANCLQQLAALPAIYHSQTRGSIFHYATAFPACGPLRQLAEAMRVACTTFGTDYSADTLNTRA